MYKIKKRLAGYPFAHRQHTHDGHCKLIHGHNWDFEIELGSSQLDENGFVYDFGKFKWLKAWLAERFDHTFVISMDDPELERFKKLWNDGLLNLLVVPSCSAEGLAKYVFDNVEGEIQENKNVKLLSVTVYEDEKNSATYTGDK